MTCEELLDRVRNSVDGVEVAGDQPYSKEELAMTGWQTYRDGNARHRWDLERLGTTSRRNSAIACTGHVAARVLTTLADSC
jgi:hypothetical protein